jgi:hypothetical protein
MFPRRALFALLTAILVFSGAHLSAQAHITENQTTYLYVDANTGNDGSSGAQTSPLKTIQAAVNKADTNNQKNIGTKIIVNAGVYREDVTIGSYRSTSAPITIQGATTGTAILDGADVLTGWSQQTSTIYSHTWTPNLGTCAIPSGWPSTVAPIVRRTEMIFVNGIPLTEVMSYGQLRAGTFWVNETTNMIYLSPSSSTTMSTAKVEASVRNQTLNVSNRTNLVFRGLVFRHAASCINTAGVTVNGSSNILFDSDQAIWNNWGGIGIYSTNNVTVQNSVASHNGGIGLLSSHDQYVLFSFNETDYNNWRGAMGAIYDWGMGGTKFMYGRSTTVQNHFSYRNQAQGLWFDTDNKTITINNATLSQNVLAALQIEANEGPILLENSHLCSSGLGVNVINTEKFTIKSNTFYNNSGTSVRQAEIYIAGKPGGRQFSDWLTGQAYDLFTSGMVVTGNTFENASSGQNVFGTYLSGNDWTQFATTLSAGTNKWHDPYATTNFKITGNKMVTLGGWQSATGTDYTSSWALPSTSPVSACSVATPTFTDFAVNLDSETYTMAAGSATATVYVNSFGYGTVTLFVNGLPSGVSASLSKTSLVSGALTLKLSASSSAANQTVPITLWATSGSRVHSITFYVHVVPS